jgi:hypothetical protein
LTDLAAFDRHRYMSLATFRKSGVEVATSVWFAAADGKLHATARILSEPASTERAHAALLAKYGWQMRLANLFSRLTARIRRRAWIEIQL